MTRLDSITTQTGKINLFQDNDNTLWIQQNNLTKAIGYNKFLSLTYSRLGQFIKNAHAVKKHGNRNVLNLKKVVEIVLPAFLKGFFRELNGQPSRKQFFGNDPAEIFHNAERILEILKEVIMSYDANSLEARKGALGEKIVKEHFESINLVVEKPYDTFNSGASIVDFMVKDYEGRMINYAEVKTQIARPYGIENAKCYSIPSSRIVAYKKYEITNRALLEMYIVDPKIGLVFFESLSLLEEPIRIDAREFPFDKYVDSMGGDFHYWHRNQFNTSFPIPDDDLIELRKLFGISEPEVQDSEPEVQEEIALPAVDSSKTHLEKLAAFANVGKADLIQAVLDLRQKKFDREQEQMKELLI